MTAICDLWQHGRVFDPQRVLHDLQDAVLRRDRQRLDDMVSDRMIWVIPVLENARGKHDWIDASCGVVWHWFRVTVRREVDLGDVRIVESHISQSREPSGHEGVTGPVTAEGIVVDAWALEGETWRLVARHPQRLG